MEVASVPAKPPAAVLPAEYELDDIRSLPQDMGAYSSSLATGALTPACQASMAAEFRSRYFSPWSNATPLADPATMVNAMGKQLGQKWYGENRLKVPDATLKALRENCDLGRLPSLNRRAISTVATNMRILPTARPFFKQPDGFPFDMLQQSGVKLNEPLRVLHVSRNGVWLFVESPAASGWVEAREVAYLDEAMALKRMGREQLVIVGESVPLRDTTGSFVRIAKVGTILPLEREDDDGYEITLAARTEPSGVMQELRARVLKSVAARHPLPFTGERISTIGNQLLGTPYGWGELYDDRDCSALLRDFFLTFGIWLGRGSYDQGNGGATLSLAGKSIEEKTRILLKSGVPFLTLVYMKGHIMLYVGNREGKPLVFQDLWGVTVRDREGKEKKQIVGKAVITTLTPGRELGLVSGPLLAKVSRIRILTDSCGSPR